MKVITRNNLEDMGGLYIENAIEGSNQYPYGSKKLTEKEAIAWIRSLAKEHTLYADFYSGRIGEESLQILKEHLSAEEMEAVQKLLSKCKEYEQEFLIFLPEEQELKLLVTLSHRELLFSTFYMVEPSMTIWSSFDGEFVIFASNKDILNEMIR